METKADSSFLSRNEFLIRRLFSLCGLVPVGAYMCVHLVTNSLMLNGPSAFQKAVDQIHSLGVVLPLVEWGFIFLPIIFHAVIGTIIIKGGLSNYGTYKTTANFRYTAQRVTGMIALVFIFWHVFHMHGWIHADWWIEGVKKLHGASFDPLHATSSTVAAFNVSILVPILYLIGVMSCVFLLAPGQTAT